MDPATSLSMAGGLAKELRKARVVHVCVILHHSGVVSFNVTHTVYSTPSVGPILMQSEIPQLIS
jgi:hypothetical protein